MHGDKLAAELEQVLLSGTVSRRISRNLSTLSIIKQRPSITFIFFCIHNFITVQCYLLVRNMSVYAQHYKLWWDVAYLFSLLSLVIKYTSSEIMFSFVFALLPYVCCVKQPHYERGRGGANEIESESAHACDKEWSRGSGVVSSLKLGVTV